MTTRRYGWKCPNCETQNYLAPVFARTEHTFCENCPACGMEVSIGYDLKLNVYAYDAEDYEYSVFYEVTTINGILQVPEDFDNAQQDLIERD